MLATNKFVAPEGKVFKCWSIESQEYAPGTTVTLTGDTVIVATWESVYKVSFNKNGGTGNMVEITTKSGAYALPASAFTAPQGKQFKGWALSANGEVVSSTINVTADTELFAIWETAQGAPDPHEQESNELSEAESSAPQIDSTAPKGGLGAGAIAAIIIGIIVVLGGAGAACFFIIKKKGKATKN